MKARQRLTLLLAALIPLGCQMEPTAPELRLAKTLQECGECPPLPAPGAAFFSLGQPEFFAGSDSFEVGVLVSAQQAISFSQFTVDYRSDCLVFRGARPGSVVPGAVLFTNESVTPAFPVDDPTSDRHILVSTTAGFAPGCKREIVRLRFRVLGTPPVLCWLRWDRSTPGGNPPNHLVTGNPAQIRPEFIEFCDRAIEYGRSAGCECPPEPPLGGADFGIGAPAFTGTDTFEVALFVNTPQPLVFSQFTVDYRTDCVQLLGVARGSAIGAGPVPFVNDGPGTVVFPVYSPDSDRHALVQVNGAYGPGCKLEVIRLQFRLVAPLPVTCWLHWDRSSPAGNPPNHVITDAPAMIRPETIAFCDRELVFRPDEPGDFVMIGIEDQDQSEGVDALAWIPDPSTGVATIFGCLQDGFRTTEAMTTRILSGSPTRIFAVDDDRLLEIDPATGEGTLIGPLGWSDVDGIAFHPTTGVLYGVTYSSNCIIEIDTATGHGTLVRDHVASGHRLEDIAFHPLTGEAYILAGGDPRVVKLDLGTGAETHWELSGATSLESLLWSLDGVTLYSAADRGDHKDLVTIDLASRTISFVGPLPSRCEDLEALAWIERDRMPAASIPCTGDADDDHDDDDDDDDHDDGDCRNGGDHDDDDDGGDDD